MDSLLSLSMREGETLKTYSDRYWEMFNEIDGDFDDVAISTFKVGLPTKHGLRKSLTGKLVTSVRQLMDRIDKYKRVEEDQQQGAELKTRRLTTNDFPLVSFDGKVVIPSGQIRLPVQTGSEVVDAYSLYTAIVARL